MPGDDDGGTMADLLDGSFDTPEGRKAFVQRRSDESTDDFASRAMAMLIQSESHWVLNSVLSSAPEDWETIPSERWLEAVSGADPVSYTHLRAHETVLDLVCRLL